MAAGWKTVRVFISSTFRDMQAERDYLVRVVFPELRERLARRRLHLVDVDLRWGITEAEAEQGRLLHVILDEIERCRPYFIALLGERYGSLPGTLPDDLMRSHPWLAEYAGRSITDLEIVHGVLRRPELAGRSFFYFRDPAFISQVPEGQRADYAPESPAAARKLAALKASIRASGRPVLEGYACHWDDGEGRLVGLESLGRRVLEDLWAAISAEHPEGAPVADPVESERALHDAFAEERRRMHVGREAESVRLTAHVQGAHLRPAVVTGASGAGKSAFLAHWCRAYAAQHPDVLLLAYFVGASPDSTQHYRLLRQMCEELQRGLGLARALPGDDQLPLALAGLLNEALAAQRTVILVLDGLDQLAPLEGAHGLGWLLDAVPPQVRLVASTLAGEPLEALRGRMAEEIALGTLSNAEQQGIVEALLGEWGRKLSERQVELLLGHPGVASPLYLRVALEELRLFGSHERLTARIQALADDVAGLFDQVLQRLEDDHGRELVAEAFGLLGAARYGLSESELLELLRPEGEAQLPRALWARLAAGARGYLVQRGELLGFFHRQLAEAVAARYTAHASRHARLAAYFARAPLARKCEEYPYQLQRAHDWAGLAAALADLELFEHATASRSAVEWLGYWRALEGRYDAGPCYQAALVARLRAEGESEHVAGLLQLCGGFMANMGDWRWGEAFFERALQMRERLLGSDHPLVAVSLHNLSHVYSKQGKLEKADEVLRRSLQIQERLGLEDTNTAIGLNTLGMSYAHRGQVEEALALFQRALAIEERLLGPDHPELIFVLNNMALAHIRQGRLAEAEALLRRGIAAWERAYGRYRPEVGPLLISLAECCERQGQEGRALLLYRRALQVAERAYGPLHPEVQSPLNNLGYFYAERGRAAEAIPLYLRALAIEERFFKDYAGPPDLCVPNLANAYVSLNRYAEALPLARRLWRTWLRACARRRDSWLKALVAGLIVLGLADIVAGLPIWGIVLIGMSALALHQLGRTYGFGHEWHVLNWLGAEAGFRVALAAATLLVWLDRLGLRLGRGSEPMWAAGHLVRLAESYRWLGRPDDAAACLRQALAICEEGDGREHLSTASVLADWAALRYQEGQHEEAKSLYARSLAIRERLLDPGHADIAASLQGLANVSFAQGDYAAALPLFERAAGMLEAALGAGAEPSRRARQDVRLCQDLIALGERG